MRSDKGDDSGGTVVEAVDVSTTVQAIAMAADTLGLYETPFFVWNSEGNVHHPTPLTSPAFFLPLVYRAADAPVPPYLALLDRMHQHVSAMQHGRIITSDGAETPEESLDSQSTQLLEDMRLVRQQCSAVTVRFDDGAVAADPDVEVIVGKRFESRQLVNIVPIPIPKPGEVPDACKR